MTTMNNIAELKLDTDNNYYLIDMPPIPKEGQKVYSVSDNGNGEIKVHEYSKVAFNLDGYGEVNTRLVVTDHGKFRVGHVAVSNYRPSITCTEETLEETKDLVKRMSIALSIEELRYHKRMQRAAKRRLENLQG